MTSFSTSALCVLSARATRMFNLRGVGLRDLIGSARCRLPTKQEMFRYYFRFRLKWDYTAIILPFHRLLKGLPSSFSRKEIAFRLASLGLRLIRLYTWLLMDDCAVCKHGYSCFNSEVEDTMCQYNHYEHLDTWAAALCIFIQWLKMTHLSWTQLAVWISLKYSCNSPKNITVAKNR